MIHYKNVIFVDIFVLLNICQVMKFWVRINGLQEGPMEIDQMKDYNITPTTYVWCAGMKDWAYARDVEDLKDVISQTECNETPQKEESSEEQQVEVCEEQPNEVCEPEKEEKENDTPMHEPKIEEPQPTPAPQQHIEEPPCPSNNLVWAILATVFCCQITGIIAIIFAAQVNSKYYSDGYKQAKRYSDMAGVWCIISIILAILSYSIFMPFMLFAPLL